MKAPRRTAAWVGAGIFAFFATCLLVMLPLWFIALNNLHPGAEEVASPPSQVIHTGIYPVEIILVIASVGGGALLGAVLNLDASPAGRALTWARGAFFGGLLLALGLLGLIFLSAF